MSVIAQHGLYGFPSAAAPSSPAPAPAPPHLPHATAALHVSQAARPPPSSSAAEINASLPPPPRLCHVVVIFGPHGVGKGTVAEALCRKHGYAHVSFGELQLNLQCSCRCCCTLNA